MARVAINGLGRIGRATLKHIRDTPELELVAVNDLVPAENLAYLLKYDTVYGRYGREVTAEDGALVIEGDRYPVYAIKEVEALPWADHKVDIVFECTGVHTKTEALRKHIEAGARHVILSAPVKEDGVAMVIHGTSATEGEAPQIISCASCTTNCITPVVEVLDRRIGVLKATLTTIHAYTSSQGLVDGPSKRVRRGRAAAANLVPTSTGAAVATTKVLPQLREKFDGVSIRAPVPVGSLADIVMLVKRPTTREEVNDILREEAQSDRYRGILAVSDEPLVSSDIIQDSRASIVDLEMTGVVDGDLVKVMSWYDNEWGYSAQMVREAVRMASVSPALAK